MHRVFAWRPHDARLEIGQRLARARGISFALSLDEALRRCDEWPIRLYELAVRDEDVVGRAPAHLRARTAEVVRQVPVTEAFGPASGDIDGWIEAARATRWLQPAGDIHRIPDLVRDHYQALSYHRPLDPRPVELVRSWRAMGEASERFAESAESPWEAAEKSVIAAATARTARCAVLTASSVVNRHVFQGAFAAGWRRAVAEYLDGSLRHSAELARANGAPDDAMHDLAGPLRAALWAGVVPAARAEWERLGRQTRSPEMLRELLAVERKALAPMRFRGALRALLELQLTVGTEYAWAAASNLSGRAMFCGMYLVRYRMSGLASPNPWEPLMRIWQLGACPLHETRHAFLVYVPELGN